MKQLSISLVLLFMLAISACANTPPPPGSLAAIHQQARKAIDTECVRALYLSVPGRRKVYYRISGGWVDVFGYCKAYAYSRVGRG